MSWAGLITLVDAKLTGGSSSVSAIQNTSGVLYARNVSTSGYVSAITNGGVVVSGPTRRNLRRRPFPACSVTAEVAESPGTGDATV